MALIDADTGWRRPPRDPARLAAGLDRTARLRPEHLAQDADHVAPVSFEGHAGWLHWPTGIERFAPAPATGVVLCPAVGRDQRCAHLPMRLFAEQLAAAGYPTLRYDHLGEGDALDLPEASNALPEWLAGVRRATEFLRRRAGARQIVLAGMRLGASLAAMAADEADGLMLFAPVVTGSGWLRELRLAGAMGGTGARAEDGGLEADGLRLSAATLASLAGLDLRRMPAAPDRVLLFASGAASVSLRARLEDLGARLDQAAFDNLAAMLEDSHDNKIPEAEFQRATAWLQDAFPVASAWPKRRLAALPNPPEPLTPPGCVEERVRFGDGLWGVLCAPTDPLAGRRAVLFCNTGGEPSAGIGRFAVSAGRALAREGIASLRFDFAGLGDSPGRAGAHRGHIYATSRAADFAAAAGLMGEMGYDRLVICGVCSGGYHALRAAVADDRFAGVLAVSPVKLVWRKGDSLAIGRRDQGAATQVYLGGLRDGRNWLRLATGRIDGVAVLRTLAMRLAARLTAPLRARDRRAFQAGMAALLQRGGRVRLLLGLDDASLDEVERHFGGQSAWAAAAPGVRIRLAEDLDHGLGRAGSRAQALGELRGLLAEVGD